MRVFRTAPRVWGIGIGHSPGGWSVQLAKWIVTTVPE